MKIAFYHRTVSGGIKTHVEALTREFEKQGHEVKRIDQFSLGSRMLGNSTGGISYGFDFALRKIKREVADCDILHIHHAATFSEYFLPFSSICSDVNVVNTFHIQAGNSLSGEVARAIISMLVTLYFGHSKKFISVSAEIADYIRQNCFVYNFSGTGNGTELVVIPNGVDIHRFYPADSEDQTVRGGGDLCLGYLGRLSPEKNVINLIKAVKTLERKTVRLKIAGTGPLYSKVKRLEDDRIEVLGYVEDAPAFYRGIDVFLLPSKLEAQPIALLEAMASGLPVIASNVGDNKYFVRKNGFLCGTSVPDIRAAISEILDADVERMGEESRRMVERDYTWDQIAAQTLAVYRAAQRSY
ncbi:MAG: glycosyltransferase family 4 protein [Candidatus Methanospirareceae archaeon]